MTCAVANRSANAAWLASPSSVSSNPLYSGSGRESTKHAKMVAAYAPSESAAVNVQGFSSTRKYRYPLEKMTFLLPFAATAFFVRCLALRSKRRAACALDSARIFFTTSAMETSPRADLLS